METQDKSLHLQAGNEFKNQVKQQEQQLAWMHRRIVLALLVELVEPSIQMLPLE